MSSLRLRNNFEHTPPQQEGGPTYFQMAHDAAKLNGIAANEVAPPSQRARAEAVFGTIATIIGDDLGYPIPGIDIPGKLDLNNRLRSFAEATTYFRKKHYDEATINRCLEQGIGLAGENNPPEISLLERRNYQSKPLTDMRVRRFSYRDARIILGSSTSQLFDVGDLLFRTSRLLDGHRRDKEDKVDPISVAMLCDYLNNSKAGGIERPLNPSHYPLCMFVDERTTSDNESRQLYATPSTCIRFSRIYNAHRGGNFELIKPLFVRIGNLVKAQEDATEESVIEVPRLTYQFAGRHEKLPNYAIRVDSLITTVNGLSKENMTDGQSSGYKNWRVIREYVAALEAGKDVIPLKPAKRRR